jgi:hypothetical protein
VALKDGDEDGLEAEDTAAASTPAEAPTEAIRVDKTNEASELAETKLDVLGGSTIDDEADRVPEADETADTNAIDETDETNQTDEPLETPAAPVNEGFAAVFSNAFESLGRRSQEPPTVVDQPIWTEPSKPAAAASGTAVAGVSPLRKLAATATGGDRSKRPPWMIATAAGAAAVIAIALIIVAVGGSSHHTTANAASTNTGSTRTIHKVATKKAVELTVSSSSPSDGATGVDGADPITITYSGKLTSGTPLPTLSPSIAGSWKIAGNQAIFTPDVGYTAGTHVTVNIPATTSGTTTTAAMTTSFTTGQYSTLRLEQLLSQLGYLPVSWAAAESTGDVPAGDANAQLSAAYNPPTGSFSFNSGYPSALTDQWTVGSDNEIVIGAVRTFEDDQNLTMDGIAGPSVWTHLLTAVSKGETSQHGYTYVYVNQSTGDDEYLDLYHDGKLEFQTPVNTGIAGRGTADGTYPVYERFPVTQMQGTNPNGTKYNDTVQWVSYFNGGDAVHYFVRYSYGFYQSLGCVETPAPYAEEAYNYMYYGNLVTVAGPES